MSTNTRIGYQLGMEFADKVIETLQPFCARIEVAGSLRRKKATIGDIELVLIPHPQTDLFDNPSHIKQYDYMALVNTLTTNGYKFVKNGFMYKQVLHPSGLVAVDLFITTPEKWGCVFTIRTGSAEFSHRLVTPKNLGGLCPSNLKFREGRLINGDNVLETPEESDVFTALGIEWIEPENR